MFDFWRKGVRHRQGGFKTQTQAKKAEKEAMARLGKMNLGFIELCEKRLEELKIRRTGRYCNENHSLIKKLVQRWGSKPIVTREDVESYLNETAKNSVTQANKELKMIKRLFEHGVERDWLESNPAKKIKLFPTSKKRKYIPPQEDITKFLMVAKPDERFYFLLMILTLGRMREINYLKWEDIYSDHLILKTRKACNSNLTERRIPISPLLQYVIDRIPQDADFLFHQKGKPYDCRKRLMATLCKQAGVKRFSFHSLRHYGASKLVEAGAPLTAVQAILGHSRATTTDTYLQELSGKKTEVMSQLVI